MIDRHAVGPAPGPQLLGLPGGPVQGGEVGRTVRPPGGRLERDGRRVGRPRRGGGGGRGRRPVLQPSASGGSRYTSSKGLAAAGARHGSGARSRSGPEAGWSGRWSRSLRAAGLGALADLGFRGLDNDVRDPVIVTGFHASRTHKLTAGQKDANRVLAIGRAPVEHGFAHLKNWRILATLRTDPARATQLLRALLVLTNIEVNR
ncbi:transposase family protein [Streptomyces chryseus]|uniref:transposase family protein n=1 Tax=Streptomyces chryseus TaxID=68186 RepID=UPI0027E3C893|nr:transposase family protein [Streptomyces chryseus]